MHISKTPIPNESFKPYTLHITVESYYEEHILKAIANAQWSIPEVIYRNDRHNFGLTQTILNKLLMVLK